MHVGSLTSATPLNQPCIAFVVAWTARSTLHVLRVLQCVYVRITCQVLLVHDAGDYNRNILIVTMFIMSTY